MGRKGEPVALAEELPYIDPTGAPQRSYILLVGSAVKVAYEKGRTGARVVHENVLYLRLPFFRVGGEMRSHKAKDPVTVWQRNVR